MWNLRLCKTTLILLIGLLFVAVSAHAGSIQWTLENIVTDTGQYDSFVSETLPTITGWFDTEAQPGGGIQVTNWSITISALNYVWKWDGWGPLDYVGAAITLTPANSSVAGERQILTTAPGGGYLMGIDALGIASTAAPYGSIGLAFAPPLVTNAGGTVNLGMNGDNWMYSADLATGDVGGFSEPCISAPDCLSSAPSNLGGIASGYVVGVPEGVVPEPTSLVMLLTGLGGFVVAGKRKLFS